MTAGDPADSPLANKKSRERILQIIRACHAEIVRHVRRAIASRVSKRDYESMMAVHGPGVGDVRYKIDVVAERAVERMAKKLNKIVACRVLCEGTGEIVMSGRAPELCILVDPIDGTRNVMADLRSAWVLTGVATERGGAGLTSRDIDCCIQTEIPPSVQFQSLSLEAARGLGCLARMTDLATDKFIQRFWRVAPARVDLRSGYFIFLKYLPRERAAIGALETAFFAAAEKRARVDPERVYDDQWLSAAGQLFLVSSGRARMFVDPRAWLAARAGVATVASHPYDVCAHLIAEEAGSPVLQIAADGSLEPLAAPLDLTTNVSFVAFANHRARRIFEPILTQALRGVRYSRAIH